MDKLFEGYSQGMREFHLNGVLKSIAEDLVQGKLLPYTCQMIDWLEATRNITDEHRERRNGMARVLIGDFKKNALKNLPAPEAEILSSIFDKVFSDRDYHLENHEYFELISDLYTCESMVDNRPLIISMYDLCLLLGFPDYSSARGLAQLYIQRWRREFVFEAMKEAFPC